MLNQTNTPLTATRVHLSLYPGHSNTNSDCTGNIGSQTQAMEELTTFLESSTIHGLAYIATGKKFVRLFWVLVVIGGFTGAGYMIHESVQSWADSPVKTTIETHPISEITFPKVTVCPPKNTYTDLNYVLMKTENMTLDIDTRNELANYAVELLYDHLHNNIMKNMTMLDEKDRYYNWYHGYTKITLPHYDSYYDAMIVVLTIMSTLPPVLASSPPSTLVTSLMLTRWRHIYSTQSMLIHQPVLGTILM